ncbi:hypothetical protein FRB90_000940 [Tulasnella sp. 427]|nr:hypothetical protein FRB90_000940 [Tulasnella sp. 427]
MVMENRGPSAAGPSRLGLTRQPSAILENPIKSAAHSSDVKGKVRPSKILNEKPKPRADVLCFGTPSRSPTPPEESSKRKRDGAEILDEKAKPAANVQRTRSSVKQAGMPTPAPIINDSSRPIKKRKLSDES